MLLDYYYLIDKRPAARGMLLNYLAPAGIAPPIPVSEGIFGTPDPPLGPFDFTQLLDDTIILSDIPDVLFTPSSSTAIFRLLLGVG